MAYARRRDDLTLADPNFYYDALDGLRNMVDGTWYVSGFIAECTRFMGAWKTKSMGGEGSNQHTSIAGERDLIYERMINVELAQMQSLDLA